jgi:hypothetical protein
VNPVALINSSNTKRLDIPHEPGQWVEVRPLTAGDIEGLSVDGSGVKVSIEALAAIISAWSYEEPVSLENVRRLDLDTFTWLGTEALKVSGVRDADEKKDSASDSSLTSPIPVNGASPVNSAT